MDPHGQPAAQTAYFFSATRKGRCLGQLHTFSLPTLLFCRHFINTDISHILLPAHIQTEANNLQAGDIVAAYWHDERWYPACIIKRHPDRDQLGQELLRSQSILTLFALIISIWLTFLPLFASLDSRL